MQDSRSREGQRTVAPSNNESDKDRGRHCTRRSIELRHTQSAAYLAEKSPVSLFSGPARLPSAPFCGATPIQHVNHPAKLCEDNRTKKYQRCWGGG